MSQSFTKNDDKRKEQLRNASAKNRAKARLFNAFVSLFVLKEKNGEISQSDKDFFLQHASKDDLELFGIEF